MMVLAIVLQAAAPTPAPAPEADRLGIELARSGTFSRLAPVMAAQQADDLVHDTPGLTAAEQAELRRTALATSTAAMNRITELMGVSYAKAMSADDMRAVIAFNGTPAAQEYRAAEPQAIAAAALAMDSLDFKSDTLKAFCAKTGKGCAAPAK